MTTDNWGQQKQGFLNAIVALMYKYFPEKIHPCPDCGGLMMHMCEKAFRDLNGVMFDKVRDHVAAHRDSEIVANWQYRFDRLLANYSADRPIPPAVIRIELEAMWQDLTPTDKQK